MVLALRILAPSLVADELVRERGDTVNFTRRTLAIPLLGSVLGLSLVIFGPRLAEAVEVGEPAPEFSLPSTTGGDVSLKDFRGKKFVLLEFYGADFVPT